VEKRVRKYEERRMDDDGMGERRDEIEMRLALPIGSFFVFFLEKKRSFFFLFCIASFFFGGANFTSTLVLCAL